jgi:hypothetical protein
MDMSAAYMAQTVEHLKTVGGYEVEASDDDMMRNGTLVFKRRRYTCRKADEQHLLLEVLTYPDGREAYFLEVIKMGAMSSYSFQLDSWKFRPLLVEFKYYIHPNTGLGLSFKLEWTAAGTVPE